MTTTHESKETKAWSTEILVGVTTCILALFVHAVWSESTTASADIKELQKKVYTMEATLPALVSDVHDIKNILRIQYNSKGVTNGF